MSIGESPRIHFWRDKLQREVDFVIPAGRDGCDAFECKWKADAYLDRASWWRLRRARAQAKGRSPSPSPSPICGSKEGWLAVKE
ncbi:MAG: hypothetical protein EXR72_23500 [Myxococcales bacterium]|nr:hypothetical protein [Myxococcales bacterium]